MPDDFYEAVSAKLNVELDGSVVLEFGTPSRWETSPNNGGKRRLNHNCAPSRSAAGFAVILALICETAPAQGAGPTAISACPYTVTAAGNYVVTRDLTASGDCINIISGQVTIDLQGHSITGNGTKGVGILGGADHIVVTNGKIQKFYDGIYFVDSFHVISQMTVERNVEYGIHLDSYYSTVTDTVVSENGSIGILGYLGGAFLTVANVQANNNAGDGMRLSTSTVANSEANGNGGVGIGLNQGGSFVINATTRGNAGDGVWLGNVGNSVTISEASNNGGNGISIPNGGALDSSNSVTGNVANNNGEAGIFLACRGNAVDNRTGGNARGNLVTSDSTCVLLNNTTK
jgi:hypothetical protein